MTTLLALLIIAAAVYYLVKRVDVRLVLLGCGLGSLVCLTAGFSLAAVADPTPGDVEIGLGLALCIAALLWQSRVLRGLQRRDWGTHHGPPASPPANPYAIACLAHGDVTLVDAALVSLAHQGVVRVTGNGPVIYRAGMLGDQAHPFEREIVDRIVSVGGKALPQLRKELAPSLESFSRELRDGGWLLTQAQRARAICVPSAVSLVIPAITGLLLGIRGGGMAFFIVFVLGVIVCLCMVGDAQRRTRAGDQLVKRLRAERGELMWLSTNWSAVTPTTLALAIALFDIGAIAETPLAELQTQLRPPVQDTGGNGG